MTLPHESPHRDSLDETLTALPLASVPASFTPGVMRRIRASATAPRFSIGWLDTILCLFAAAMVSALVWIAYSVNSLTILRVRHMAQLLLRSPDGNWAMGGIALAALAAPFLLFLAARLFLAPRRTVAVIRR